MAERSRRNPALARRRRAIWWWSLVVISVLAVSVAAYVVRRSGGLQRPTQPKAGLVHALALAPEADPFLPRHL